MKILLAILIGCFAQLGIPCCVSVDAEICPDRSYYDSQGDFFVWGYTVTATGCSIIDPSVDWYIAFEHIDKWDYRVAVKQSVEYHTAGTKSGIERAHNPGLQITPDDKLAVSAYAQCPNHPDQYDQDLSYCPINIR